MKLTTNEFGVKPRILTRDEVEFVRNYNGSKCSDWMAEKLGITVEQYMQVLRRLCLTRRYVRWTEEDDKFLEENYKLHGSKYVAAKLNRSVASVCMHAQRIDVRIRGKRRKNC